MVKYNPLVLKDNTSIYCIVVNMKCYTPLAATRFHYEGNKRRIMPPTIVQNHELFVKHLRRMHSADILPIGEYACSANVKKPEWRRPQWKTWAKIVIRRDPGGVVVEGTCLIEPWAENNLNAFKYLLFS